MKHGKAVPWFMGNLQRSLFSKLEECRQLPLTKKEQRLITLLEMLQVEKLVLLVTKFMKHLWSDALKA